jgi:hypothetical protein
VVTFRPRLSSGEIEALALLNRVAKEVAAKYRQEE